MKSKPTGFTLIELLVVIAIIAILTAMILPLYDTAGQNFALERSINNLAQEIRRTEQMAISGETIGNPGENFYPAGGYGIRFEESGSSIEAFIFADCDNDHRFTGGTDICNGSFSEKIKDITLEEGIKIESFSKDSGEEELDITFRSPNPTITFYSGRNEFLVNEVTITLSFLEDGNTKSLKINKAGLIEL